MNPDIFKAYDVRALYPQELDETICRDIGRGFVAYLGWTIGSGTDVPISGYVSMALGVVLSLAVGFGLMGLVFYSSRRGYDEAPVYITTEDGSGPKSAVDNEGEKR